jgi:hypothetical protein
MPESFRIAFKSEDRSKRLLLTSSTDGSQWSENSEWLKSADWRVTLLPEGLRHFCHSYRASSLLGLPKSVIFI